MLPPPPGEVEECECECEWAWAEEDAPPDAAACAEALLAWAAPRLDILDAGLLLDFVLVGVLEGGGERDTYRTGEGRTLRGMFEDGIERLKSAE